MADTLVKVNVPDIATKQLAFRQRAGRRVLTISSNLLTLFGFTKGDDVIETSLGKGKGMVIERCYDLFSDAPTKKVYSRTWLDSIPHIHFPTQEYQVCSNLVQWRLEW